MVAAAVFQPMHAVAQQSAPLAPSVLSPLVTRPAVPPPALQPIFVPPPPVEDAPDLDWRQSNDDAARLGGHVGQLRGRPATPRN